MTTSMAASIFMGYLKFISSLNSLLLNKKVVNYFSQSHITCIAKHGQGLKYNGNRLSITILALFGEVMSYLPKTCSIFNKINLRTFQSVDPILSF